MAGGLKHAFVNPKADGADATVQRPSDWNADHVLSAFSVRATNTAASSIAAAGTVVPWPTEDHDTDAQHDLVTNNSRLTCKKAGKYVIDWTVYFAVPGTATYLLSELLKNGSLIGPSDLRAPTAANGGCTGGSTTLDLALNDYIEIEVFHNASGNISMYNVAGFSAFSMSYVGG